MNHKNEPQKRDYMNTVKRTLFKINENESIYCIICTDIIDDTLQIHSNASTVYNGFPYIYR